MHQIVKLAIFCTRNFSVKYFHVRTTKIDTFFLTTDKKLCSKAGHVSLVIKKVVRVSGVRVALRASFYHYFQPLG